MVSALKVKEIQRACCQACYLDAFVYAHRCQFGLRAHKVSVSARVNVKVG